MKLHDVAVMTTKGGGDQRFLCVATLLESADGLQPSKSRAEKRIIGEIFCLSIAMILISFPFSL